MIGCRVLALAQHVLLGVVDGLLSGEHAEEERDRQRSGGQRDQRRRASAAGAACREHRRRCGSPSPETSWCGCTLRPTRAGSTGIPESRWAPRTRSSSGRGSGSTRTADRPWRRWPAATCRSRSAAPPAAPDTSGDGRADRCPAGPSARRCRRRRTPATPSRCRCTGLKFRRTEPFREGGQHVARMPASSRTSMLRRQRLTILVLAMTRLPVDLHQGGCCPNGTAGIT